MEVTNGNGDLFVITERGYGKRTPVADYPEQNRGGQGVYTIQMTERKGNLAAMKTVGPQHELFIVTEGATVIRVKTDEISQTGRATGANTLQRFSKKVVDARVTTRLIYPLRDGPVAQLVRASG